MKARENPFRSERIEALGYRPQGFVWEGFLDRLEAVRAGAVVGPEGSGKTALLESLEPRLVARGCAVRLLRLRGGCDIPSRGGGSAPRALLVDGLEGLGRKEGPFLESLRAETDLLVAALHRPGPLPMLVTCTTSVELLGDLVVELVGWDGLTVVEDLLPGLFARHRGNLRACFLELYDVWAEVRGTERRE